MSLDFEKRKAILFPTQIYEDSLLKYFKYYYLIIKYVEKGKKIPAKVFEEYFSCFKTTKATQKERKIFIEALVENTYEKFKDKYDFEKKYYGTFNFTSPKPIPYKPIKDTYSFKEMLYIIYDKTLEHLQKNKEITKTHCIQFIYEIIESYRKNFTEEHLKHFEKYKIGALCSYVAIQLKYSVSSNVKLTNYKLFQMSRSAISHLKKKR